MSVPFTSFRLRWARISRWVHGALAVALGVVCGCDEQDGSSGDETAGPAAPSVVASAAGREPGRFVQPPQRPFEPNPLRLPVVQVTVEEGTTVYAPLRRALDGAELGSTLVLRHATALGTEGGLVVVRHDRRSTPFAVHPGYLIVPRPAGRLRRGSYVLVPYRGNLRHGVVASVRRERITVQYTDLGVRIGERRLPQKWIAPQPAGLAPGNFAVVRRGGTLEHVLLVSSGTWGDGKRRWLALGHGAAATLVDHESLIPLSLDFDPSGGDPVLVAWQGRMVPATVRAVDEPGLYRVERPYVAPSLVYGADHLLPAPSGGAGR